MKFGFVFALESEFNAFKANIEQSFHYLEPYYMNGDESIIVIISGVGKSHAAMATTRLLQDYAIDLVINIGVAGGISLKKGDVVLVKKTLFHDVDVVAFGYLYGQLPQAPLKFKPDTKAYESLKSMALSNDIQVHEASVATGDQFVESIDVIYQAIEMDKNIKAIEMELASIALACHHYQTPWVSLKAVSDEIGSGSQTDDFNKMLERAMKPISTLIKRAFLSDY